MLERGAVEGEIFHRGAVQALAPEETQVTPRLAALVRRELDPPRPAPSSPARTRFRFRHLLIRDAAYDALPKATRADLHRRFADWLDEHGAEPRRAATRSSATTSSRPRATSPSSAGPIAALAEEASRRLAAAGDTHALARRPTARRTRSSAGP